MVRSLLLAYCLTLGWSIQPPDGPPMVLLDRFGRDLHEKGVTLVDWDGHLANPAARLTIRLHPRVKLPARVVLRANGCRLMFNLFSEVGPDGPTKTLLFERTRQAEFLMAVAPDRDSTDETYELTADLTSGMHERRTARWRVTVKDFDRKISSPFKVRVDYGQDRTGFFDDPKARRIFEQAVADWTYFLAEQDFEEVPAQAETAWVHDPTTFERGWTVTNAEPYTGFLLFGQGIRGPEKRCGARASHRGGLQVRKGKLTGLRRSGTVIAEVTGNWNGLGWSMEESDDRWWVSSCHATEPHDFYSVIRHETAHALLYHRVHPGFARLIRQDRLRDRDVERYLGTAPKIGRVEHLFETVDPISRVGAFGNEYGGDMPRKRWWMTKLDLLVMRAAGYRLREEGPLQPVSLPRTIRLTGRVGTPITGRVDVAGGVPDYCFRVVGGTLPPGVSLDSFTGILSGTPSTSGIYRAVVQAEDADPACKPVRTVLVCDTRETTQ